MSVTALETVAGNRSRSVGGFRPQGWMPAEELSRLRHAPLPPSSALFPPTLLDTALSKTHAASNDALVHKALHPPRIPKRQPQQQNRASSSSAAPAD